MKSSHHLFHDRASKGHGSSPGFTSQTSLHACLQRLTAMSTAVKRLIMREKLDGDDIVRFEKPCMWL